MNNEFGKSVLQYKNWMPDWYLTRFGEKGSFSGTFLRGGIKEMKDSIQDKGFLKTFASGEDTQAVKDFKSNVKGLMITATLMILANSGDDDKKKSDAVKVANKALSDVMFIFDPNNLKFTLSRPIASIGKINDLLDAVSHLKEFDGEKSVKDVEKLLPAKKILDVVDYLESED
jgi:hypothetical protein